MKTVIMAMLSAVCVVLAYKAGEFTGAENMLNDILTDEAQASEEGETE